MEKQKLIVPKGIRYVSQWEGYSLKDFEFPHILDKKIPGCGYTEYCLTSNIPIVLCSPRRMLLENKEEQHDNVFYFRNEDFDSINTSKDISSSKDKETIENLLEENRERIDLLYQKLSEYILHCQISNIPPKILVTYDSFRLVRDYLEKHNLFSLFHVVVDEWQSIFVDSRFKSSSEIEFLNYLQGFDRLCFVSATPMIDEYLKMMPEFKDLPYFEFDWETEDLLRVTKPKLIARTTKSAISSAKEVIENYKSGKFEEYSYKDDSGTLHTVVSNEAVLYINSVKNICDIIRKCRLSLEECNILCAKTPENEKKVRDALNDVIKEYNNRLEFDRKSKEYKENAIPTISSKIPVIGSVPLKGESHKMFTLCTRTVYLGADFYSLCARTFIFSDANIDSLSVDITLDLPQILGRQRLIENPWKNRAELYFKPICSGKIMSKEEFDLVLEKKIKNTNSLLKAYNNKDIDFTEEDRIVLANKYKKSANTQNYKDDYVSVNEHIGSSPIPCFNQLVYISELRSFDLQQIDYADRFSVFNVLSESKDIDQSSNNNISKFILDFNSLTDSYSKLKLLCNSGLNENEISVTLDLIPMTYKTYYMTLGPDRIKANGYNITDVANEFSLVSVSYSGKLSNEIYATFQVGNRYLKSSIKDELKNIYTNLGIDSKNRKPKASDLSNYFEIKSCTIVNKETGKRDNGFEILKRL